MKQNFFVAIAAVGIIGASFAACTVETTDSTTSGTSSSTAASGSGGSAAGTGGGGGAAAGTGGTGGGSACLSCAEYTADATAGIEDTCGYSDDGCEAGSSCQILVDLGDCTCGNEDIGAGNCTADCPVSCGEDENGDDSACQTCALAMCQGEAGAVTTSLMLRLSSRRLRRSP